MVYPADHGFKPSAPPRPYLAFEATSADLRPGPALRALLHATARHQHLLARRCRLNLRQFGYHIVVGRPDMARVDEAAYEFDQLIEAARAKDFARATAARELLRLAFDIRILPLSGRVKAVTR